MNTTLIVEQWHTNRGTPQIRAQVGVWQWQERIYTRDTPVYPATRQGYADMCRYIRNIRKSMRAAVIVWG